MPRLKGLGIIYARYLSLPSLRQHSVMQLDRNNEFKEVLYVILDNYGQFPKAPTPYASRMTDRCSTRMSVNLVTLADVGTDPLIDIPKLASSMEVFSVYSLEFGVAKICYFYHVSANYPSHGKVTM